jgi:OOP family OmpA-OmpF porin
MRAITCLIVSVFFFDSQAQNLVPNPSFEDTIKCPTNPGQLNRTALWISPTAASPDYFNSCDPTIYGMNIPYTGFGYQNSHSGNAMAGFYAFQKGIPNYREYIQVKLTDTLQQNHKYYVSFRINLTNWSQYSLSSIGAYLSSNPISTGGSSVLNYTPQIQSNPLIQLSDTVNWMLIADTLISDGTEEYITIGNFKNDGQSDTVYLGWWSSNNIAYYYIDDVSVIDVLDLGISEAANIGLRVFPNPASSTLSIEARLQDAEAKICDVLGNVLLSEKLNYKKQLNISQFPKGIYFLQLQEEGKNYTSKFVKD